MNKYKELFVNTLYFLLNTFATKLISFILVPLYTSSMSAADYGLTDMSQTVISLLTPLVTLNISEAVLRFILEDKDNTNKYICISLAMTLFSVLIVALLGPLFNVDAFGGLGSYHAWFVLAYASNALFLLCGNVARAVGEIRLTPICAAVASLVTLIFTFLFVWIGQFDIVEYYISIIIGPSVGVLLYLSIGKQLNMALHGLAEVAGLSRRELQPTLLPLLRYALPLIPNSLFWWMGTSINRLFITGQIGIAASGLFSAAGKIPSLINTAYSVFQQAWQLSAYKESGRSKTPSFYSAVFRAVQAGLTLLCGLISVLSPWFASVLLKGETFSAWPMIPMLLLANTMSMLSMFFGTVYTSTMNTGFIMRSTLYGAVACTVMTPLCITQNGLYGACFASVVSQGLVLILRGVDSKKYLSFDAGWRRLAPSLGILFIQSMLVALRPTGWDRLSILCFIAIVIIQMPSLIYLLSRLVGVTKSYLKTRNS